ncbi:hypothetical protein [Bacillus marinisedimentorum]|uniref:hypothetical protein n=1 Tax=Bacillus marinisedimentorum TaxID=1821260 RepID=UPI0012FFA210|nr:hypothetical protein [Bacillus marinisedimentorum]
MSILLLVFMFFGFAGFCIAAIRIVDDKYESGSRTKTALVISLVVMFGSFILQRLSV